MGFIMNIYSSYHHFSLLICPNQLLAYTSSLLSLHVPFGSLHSVPCPSSCSWNIPILTSSEVLSAWNTLFPVLQCQSDFPLVSPLSLAFIPSNRSSHPLFFQLHDLSFHLSSMTVGTLSICSPLYL